MVRSLHCTSPTPDAVRFNDDGATFAVDRAGNYLHDHKVMVAGEGPYPNRDSAHIPGGDTSCCSTSGSYQEIMAGVDPFRKSKAHMSERGMVLSRTIMLVAPSLWCMLPVTPPLCQTWITAKMRT